MDSINIEEIIFYLDLSTDYISKEILIKLIKNFIEHKQKFSERSSFGIVILQQDYNPVFVYDQTDVDLLTNVIDVKYDLRPRDQSYIENGLFEVLSYIFSKSREEKKIFRVIAISDTPTKRSDEYHQAIYNLIIKSKRFSTIIDIVRVGDQESYEDDVKLNVITSETQGGLFHCNLNQFFDVLGSLTKSKREFNVIQSETEGGQIFAEDKIFYERMAVDLISLDDDDEEICDICQFELCPVCGAYSDEIHKCYNCGSRFHNCCIARYSISNNIGFKHIFRCPKCQNLLKIDEDYVELIYDEDFEELEETQEFVLEKAGEYDEQYEITQEQIIEKTIKEHPIEEVTEEHSLEAIEESQITLEDLDEQIKMADKIIETMAPIEEITEEPQLIEEIEPLEEITVEPLEEIKIIEKIEPVKKDFDIEKTFEDIQILKEPPPPPPPMKKVKVGGYFGHEVEIGVPIKKGKKRQIKVIEPQFLEEKKSITELKPPRKRERLKFCKICGATIKNVIVCKNCGAKID